jgi:chromosomal replication initiation ATPase DnaA
MGGRDHSTVLHGIAKVCANFYDYAKLIESVERQMRIE